MMLLALALACAPQEGLGADEFRRLHDELRPPTGEVWRSIPWKIDLLEVRAEAARTRKPIFIWSMDGNPLGCG